jgi:hypothetical protein
MNYQDKIKISELVVRNLEGDLTDQQRQELNEIVGASTGATAWYLEFMDMLSCFTKYGTTDVPCFDFDSAQDGQFGAQTGADSNISLEGIDINDILAQDKEQTFSLDSNIMQAMRQLAECERTAPKVIVEKPIVERELIRNVDNSNFKIVAGKANKLSLCAAVFFAACLTALLGYAYFTPAPAVQPVVAQLIDQIDAVWDKDMQLPYNDGQMLQDTYRLTAGFASIRFNDGASVTIEAPAEWSLQSSGNMELFSGQIYAVVPEQARGFSVTAGNTKIIDRGTEFGVEVDKYKSTQLHVIKGRTLLFYGSKEGKKFEKEVSHGQARQVGSTGKVRNIPLDRNKFAKRIDSSTGLVFNGHATLDLGDVVGGGNGRGTGKLHTWLDVRSGQFTDLANPDKTAATATYVNVGASDYIDGVFTPDGGSGQVQVSSAGHIFSQCPDTKGEFQYNISNGHDIFLLKANLKDITPCPPVLAGKRYGTKEDSVIILTTNKGITFDLEALRKVLPDSDIQRFTAICGLSERDIVNGISLYYGGAAKFWVLVDGQMRFSAEIMRLKGGSPDTPAEINVPINRKDRFLTLIATDGITIGRDFFTNIDSDYSVFAKPILHLSEKTTP